MWLLILGLLMMPAFVLAAELPSHCFDYDAFPAEVFDGPYLPPALKKGTPAYEYRTLIRKGAIGPPNFAGRFRVVTVGCGTNCTRVFIVDRRSGKAWMGNIGGAFGYQYHADSRLMVVDPPNMIREAGSFPVEVETISYIWDDNQNAFEPLPSCDGYAQQRVPAESGESGSGPGARRR